MRLRVDRVTRPLARSFQAAYAAVIRGGSPRVPHEGTQGSAGGSLAGRVEAQDLVSHRRWGFAFTPSKLGDTFRWWWSGTRRQQARGRAVPIDEAKLARDLELELARQVEAEDRRAR